MRSAPCLVREKTRKVPVSSLQHLVEQAELLVLHDGAGAQLDLFAGMRGLADLDTHRIADVVADDLAHVGVQRGGVAHGLAGAGKRADDAADGGQKAHVQHAVHFVQHQHLDRADVDGAAAEKVFQPAGGCDHEARAAGELVELGVLAEAADRPARRRSWRWARAWSSAPAPAWRARAWAAG